MSSLKVRTLVSICFLVLTCSSLWGQSATATILGRVTDPQGAAVASAAVTATNTATQVVYKTATDAQGDYRVLALPIGTYTVAVEHEGFSKLVTAPRTLQINQQERIDLELTIGTHTETVEVTGVGSNVETVNPTLGQSVTSRPIVNLPLNGRDVLDLALLQPGVSESNPDDGSQGHFSVGGGRADSVTFLLDGGVNNDLLGNGVVLDPNPDTVAEFRILTSNYTAEYGRNGAGVISVVTKSGTNQLHGSAFEFARNTDFDANAYFNKNSTLHPDGLLPRNDLKRHQFGATFGGPITIPHLVEGKDKYFFFVAYQGQRQTQAQTTTTSTFTPDELNNGDFSQAGDAANVVSFLQANPYFLPVGGNPANAIIDPNKFDPAAINYIKLGLIPTANAGTLTQSGDAKDDRNEFTAKVDLNFSGKDKLSITLGGFRNPQTDPFSGGNDTVTGFGIQNHTSNYFLNIGYTRTFSPTMLNEFRVTAQRHNVDFGAPLANLPTGAQLGFGIVSDISTGPPQMFFDNGLEFGANPQGPAFEIGNTFAYTDTLTWVKGNNTWKFGGGFSAYQNNTLYDFYGNGFFDFFADSDPGGTGDSLADFLVGTPEDLFEAPNASNNIRSKSVYGFLQDEWRVRKNLTLTLGVRYEYSQPKRDTQGRTFNIIPNAHSTRFPNAPIGVVFPGDPGAPRGVNFPDKDNFGPRIGFAWDPRGNGKMSVRGGIGLFYDVLKGEDNLQFNGAPPFYSEVDGFFSDQGPYLTNGAPFFSNPWPQAGLTQPFPSQPPTKASAFDPATGNSLPFGGPGIYFVDPHLHTPYTYQYNLSVQGELAKNLTAEVSYVGSSSKGLTSLVDVNPFILSTLNTNPTRRLNVNQSTDLGTFCDGFGGSVGYAADCPISSAIEFANLSFANFNSLEASLTKQNGESRIFGNTYFTLAYTYGHSIDNASGFRNRSSNIPFYNHGQFRSSSDFDLRNRITFSGGWDLPFDKVWGDGPKRVVKGWSLYPIFTWRTGFPLTINGQLSVPTSDPGPSGAGDPSLANALFAPGFNHITIVDPRKNANVYFDPAAFQPQPFPDVLNPSNPYGLPRNFFRGPGRTNLDMALAKTTAITEHLNSEIRLEAFNVFNHGEFANPDTNVFSGTFGQITTTDFGSGQNTLHTERILQLAVRLTF